MKEFEYFGAALTTVRHGRILKSIHAAWSDDCSATTSVKHNKPMSYFEDAETAERLAVEAW